MVISLATFRLEYCRIYTSFYFTRSAEPAEIDWKTAVFILPFARRRDFDGIVQIGRLPYLYFLLLLGAMGPERVDWKTAVLLLPFTVEVDRRFSEGLEDCRVTTSFYCRTSIGRLEYCRIYTSFYSSLSKAGAFQIGILPYLYFLLLINASESRYSDWNTAVLLLPFTHSCSSFSLPQIGRLPYYYFLLLWKRRNNTPKGLEDCRIITSFYSKPLWPGWKRIGRLPYYYFLLLLSYNIAIVRDWKTAVLLLPSTPAHAARTCP